MALEGTQLDALKQLGISYPQLVDYYSKQRATTLVGLVMTCKPFTYIDSGSSLHFGLGNMGLYHHIVCTLPSAGLNTVDTSHSDGEIAFFWQAKNKLRWSVARILFMLVSYCTC